MTIIFLVLFSYGKYNYNYNNNQIILHKIYPFSYFSVSLLYF